jgi:hypothetical protein
MIFVQVSTLASILNILLHSNGTAKGLTMVPTDIYDHSLLLEERKTNIDDDRGLQGHADGRMNAIQSYSEFQISYEFY